MSHLYKLNFRVNGQVSPLLSRSLNMQSVTQISSAWRLLTSVQTAL